MTTGDFNLQTDMKVFMDLGHDTIKCARIFNEDWMAPLNHFELPTVLIKEVKEKQQKLTKSQAFDSDWRVSKSFKFFRNNIDTLCERVLEDRQMQ